MKKITCTDSFARSSEPRALDYRVDVLEWFELIFEYRVDYTTNCRYDLLTII